MKTTAVEGAECNIITDYTSKEMLQNAAKSFNVDPKKYCFAICLGTENFKVVDILYYYFCPIAWTVYGTQKVLPDPSIKWSVQNHLGYDLNFKAPTDVILVASAAFSALMFAVCIKILNFQHR
ncbi:hypothetical protein Q3G72_034318 [Acer saccharum]|nr:hypothetical protein Q3G72_034318 [Acer saccharum]